MTYEIERIANGWLVRSNPFAGTGVGLPPTFAGTLDIACQLVQRHHLDPRAKPDKPDPG